MSTEKGALEHEDDSLWRSAIPADTITAEEPHVFCKKKKLTAQQKMKGLAKAFVSADNAGGWAKVAPVFTPDESSGEEDSDSEKGDVAHSGTVPSLMHDNVQTSPPNERDDDGSDDNEVDLAALLRQEMEADNVNTLGAPPNEHGDDDSDDQEVDLVALLRQGTKQLQEDRQSDTLEAEQESEKAVPESYHVEKDDAVASRLDMSGFNLGQIKPLQHLIHIAEREGHEAAMRWARENVQKSGTDELQQDAEDIKSSQDQSFDPRSLPHPKRMAGEDSERQLISYYREAAALIPYEYASELTTFVIRRPYGNITSPQVFESLSSTSHQNYSRMAHISAMSTLEVAVVVYPDMPLLLLYGEAGARYLTHPNDDELQNLDNAKLDVNEEHDTIYYMDTFGSPQQFKVTELLEEAMLVREHYCATMTTMALGLKTRPKEVASPLPSVETMDVAIDTSDLEIIADAAAPPIEAFDIAVDTSDLEIPLDPAIPPVDVKDIAVDTSDLEIPTAARPPPVQFADVAVDTSDLQIEPSPPFSPMGVHQMRTFYREKQHEALWRRIIKSCCSWMFWAVVKLPTHIVRFVLAALIVVTTGFLFLYLLEVNMYLTAQHKDVNYH